MKPLLVGEANPYQEDNADDADRFAFYPEPPQASGGRLCFGIMQLDERTYLRSYDRTNLCHPKWSLPAARKRAAELMAERVPSDVIVLFGAKVAKAFGLPSTPFQVYVMNDDRTTRVPIRVVLPHPSGLCRVWHEPDAFDRARAVLRDTNVLPRIVNGHHWRCQQDACVMGCPIASAEMSQRIDRRLRRP